MLEALVSSRVRRQLFEYLLAHPSDRFYLRGLAKDLGLSISPLRRELKRLERSGMLRGSHEGNIVFYTVDAGSPAYQELAGAGHSPVRVTPALAVPGAGAIPVGVIRHEAQVATARRVWPVALAAIFGLAGVAATVDLSLRVLAHQRRDVRAAQAGPSASGVMRGTRWQVVPGGFGGFSNAAPQPTEAF